MRKAMVFLLSGMVLGCSSGNHDDVKQWMAENSKGLRGNVPKLPEVQPYEAVPYDVQGLIDPFKPGKLEPEGQSKKSAGKDGAFQPDFEARELRNNLLEKYPLESLKMIGFLNVNKRPMAVIQVEDKVKQIKVGDYLGLDFGMVTKITDSELELRELVQDSSGDWSERKSTLNLQKKEVGGK